MIKQNELLAPFIHKVIETRESAGLSIHAMASNLGVEDPFYRDFERQKYKVRMWNVYLMAQCLQIDILGNPMLKPYPKMTQYALMQHIQSQCRNYKNISTKELATAMDMTLRNTQTFLNGDCKNTVANHILKYAEVIGIHPDELLPKP